MRFRGWVVGALACVAVAGAGQVADAQIRMNGGRGGGSGGPTTTPTPTPTPGPTPTTPSSAPAGSSDIIDGHNVNGLAQIIRDLGYQAKIGTAKDGTPKIDSAVGGQNFMILTYSCDKPDGNCSIDFWTYWSTGKNPLTEKRINEWNREWRYVKIYNDTDGDLNLQFSVDMTGGITKANFISDFERWVSMVPKVDNWRNGRS